MYVYVGCMKYDMFIEYYTNIKGVTEIRFDLVRFLNEDDTFGTEVIKAIDSCWRWADVFQYIVKYQPVNLKISQGMKR